VGAISPISGLDSDAPEGPCRLVLDNLPPHPDGRASSGLTKDAISAAMTRRHWRECSSWGAVLDAPRTTHVDGAVNDDGGGADGRAPATETPSASDEILRGLRVLVVEDNALVASSLVLLLQTAGIQAIGPVGRLAGAVRVAATAAFDAAVLDIKLNREPVWDVADVLVFRRIPFAFATGYDPDVMVPPRFADAPVLAKPHSDAALFAVLRSLMDGAADPGRAACM
jgi:CheY-like chemotaxis protein